MAFQELDLEIHHYSGKSNVVADTLSHNPVPVADAFKIVAHSLSPDLPTREGDISKLQREDLELSLILQYLENGVLPPDNEQARKLTFLEPHFDVIEGMLYFDIPADLVCGELQSLTGSSSLIEGESMRKVCWPLF